MPTCDPSVLSTSTRNVDRHDLTTAAKVAPRTVAGFGVGGS
jgi:hypothetical protein